ncbi:MAG: hypothetical protein LBM61_00130, partial [Prevotellaceae bacterium]|nr:hypothetical protein [Prevotellaceae bacterium]
YSLVGYIKLFVYLLRTKLICPQARIIRFPIDLRGRQYMDFGQHLTTGRGCRLEAFSTSHNKCLLFGNDVQINDYVHISAMERVVIGNNVLMASHIYISDNSHGAYKGDSQSTPDIPPIKRDYYVAPVQIEDNVWIGEGVIIMPGVSVGHGSVIGANSVVTKNIPADSIAVGNPAKVIKTFDTLQSQWIATASRNIL